MKSNVIQAVIAASIILMLGSCSTVPKTSTPPVPQAPNNSVESLLNQMAQAYASVKSYADSGVVYDYHNGVLDQASTGFRIHFVRPDRLRFEMMQNIGSPYFDENYTVMWSYGSATYKWSQSYPQIQASPDVTSAIAQLTGVSGRAVHNIPSLFQKNFGWQEYLYGITSPKVLGEEVFEAINCYRIQGDGRGERRFEIWIGKSDHLIRKIQTTYPGFASEEIHRGIAINQPISADMLTFTPPLSNVESMEKTDPANSAKP